MSLTGTHHAFAGLSERGVNEAVGAFFGARPHYLRYGTTPFVASTSVGATNVPTIPFPGIPGGISYEVELSLPRVDLNPADGPLPAPLALGPDRLSVMTNVRVTLGCWRGMDKDDRKLALTPISTTLETWAVGHPVSHFFSPGVGNVRFAVDEVAVVGIEPETLDALIDCLLRMILSAVLSQLRLPFAVINAGVFRLVLEEGPRIDEDQIKLWGDVT